jgi:hypothetical protein
MRRNAELWRLPTEYVGTEPNLAYRSIIGERGAQAQRIAGVEQPELGRVDLVPVRALALVEQEQDGGRRGALPLRGVGAPCLAIPAAFGMRREAERFDEGAGIAQPTSPLPSFDDTRHRSTPPSVAWRSIPASSSSEKSSRFTAARLSSS